MEKFDFINVLILSMPEFFMGFMLILILFGKGSDVPFKCDNKFLLKNFLKLLSVSFVLSLIDAIVDNFVTDMNISEILLICSFCVILKFVYKLSWKNSALGVMAFLMVLLSFESAYIPLCLRLFYNGSQANLFNSPDLKRFLCSLPIRVVQVIVLISIWDINYIIQKIKLFNLNSRRFIFIIIAVYLFEMNSANMYMQFYDSLSIFYKITGGVCCLGVGILNFSVLYFYVKSIVHVSKFNTRRSVKNNG